MHVIKQRKKIVLTEAQKQMYASEKLMNFRWVAKMAATYSPYILSPEDIADQKLFTELAEIGQFTELAYTNAVPVEFLFKNLDLLMNSKFPLEGYNALHGSVLVSEFFGRVAHLHGYVAYRPKTKQLVVATSGTSTAIQAIQDLRTLWHRHKSRRGFVHSGFWQLYKGIRPFILEGIRKGFKEHEDIEELVITGHSMGAAVSYILLLDQILVSNEIIPADLPIKLAAFGAPRPGDDNLSRYYQELIGSYRSKYGDAAFSEHLVKAYNDGVPALPPLFLGYRHFTQSPLYYDHMRLYHIPPSDCEYTLFHVDAEKSLEYPRGGHNYYNGRDQEMLLRRLGWLEKSLTKGDTHWQETYLERVKKHSR
ncbi:Alpha/Beta hydrolase protein [Lentinula aciculospora]|uniref:Alpha/Beta hydrolase protein n=1 Tax=Lentinula aciculospora TaxID=153920 RepID=A0A9W9AVA4_9AGAR|nr:Alpha/Beta hydrolase protein [Lentinula aciculospora]